MVGAGLRGGLGRLACSLWHRVPLAELLDPAIGYAERRFPVTEVIAHDWLSSEASLGQLARFGTDIFCPAVMRLWSAKGSAIQILPPACRTIAAGGRDAFYRGEMANTSSSSASPTAAYFSLADFAEHANEWVEPVSTNYRGYDVWELPPNGQGIAALQMLNLLEAYDLKSLGRGSPEYLHLLIEAKKLAFADRASFYSDPDFGEPPVAELISKPYAERRRRLIDPERAATDVREGDPKLARGDTVYLVVVDKDRNCCSFIQSIYYGFGSQVVPGDVGFALQNRGALFALDEHHPNRLQPHKRPFHTIIPAMVTRDGKPWLAFGVMGGDMQPQGHVQVLVNMIDFGMNVQAAGDAARVRHAGSATPTGLAGDSRRRHGLRRVGHFRRRGRMLCAAKATTSSVPAAVSAATRPFLSIGSTARCTGEAIRGKTVAQLGY